MNPSVVVVGRGASLLKRELGPIIDSFDIVIRVNHAPTIPKHTGSKTTIFSSRVISKIEKFLNIITDVKKLWICDSPSISYDGILKTLVGVETTFMTNEEIDSLKVHFVGYGNNVKPNDDRFDVCMPDTGISTIHCAIRRFPDSKIGVCGIDLYDGGNKNIIREEDISSIFKMPVLLQTLYYKKMVHMHRIQEVWKM